MGFLPSSWGKYPPEYNRAVHGFYDPAVYYGKRDTPLTQVKLGELGAWLGRRNKSPRAMVQCISRAKWRFIQKWIIPKRPGGAGILQVLFFYSGLNFMLSYGELKKEKRYRYH